MNYNEITELDDINVINEKLRTNEYYGLTDEEIHEILLQNAVYDPSIFMVFDGQVIRK